MNKINQLFSQRADRKLLSLYFCAGCPTLDGTGEVILAMQDKGIDMELKDLLYELLKCKARVGRFHELFSDEESPVAHFSQLFYR